ncbi:MAG: AMIN domain-containing protein [Blastocatellia bacterium]|nr:AMIN domain-containing protein [Blastocatellia bacterium]
MSIRKRTRYTIAVVLLCALPTPLCGGLLTARSLANSGKSGDASNATSARSTTAATLIHSVRAEKSDSSVRVLVDAEHAVGFDHFTLTDPPRIVVDLERARSIFNSKTIPVSKAGIERVRIGSPGQGTIRIVLDLEKPIPYAVVRDGNSIIITTEKDAATTGFTSRAYTSSQPVRYSPSKVAYRKGGTKISFLRDDDKDSKDKSDKDSKDKDSKDSKDKDSSGKSGKDGTAPGGSASKKDGNSTETDDEKTKQGQFQGKIVPKGATIIVGDRTLTGQFSSPQMRGSRLFLPVVSVARALGDDISVSPLARTVDVRRQSGVSAQFNAQLSQVLEHGALILSVSNTADIAFSPNSEELMLPAEIVASLLDVSIFVDERARAVRITRGREQASTAKAGARHASWEFYQIDHAYNLNLYSSSFYQNFTLNTVGRLWDGRFTFTTNFDGGSSREPVMFRRGTFNYEKPDGRRFTGGDFGTGNDLSFMAAALRGVSIQQPLENMRLNAFAGRALSILPTPVIEPVTGLPVEPLGPKRPAYDTNVVGSYVSFGPSALRFSGSSFLLFSAGGLYFGGPVARGTIATGSVKYSSSRNQFQADAGIGNFEGFRQDGSMVEGAAPVIEVSEVFKLRDSLTLQGRVAHISPNYLSPQSGGSLTSMDLVSGGFNWRPAQWIGTSLTATNVNRLDNDKQKQQYLTGTLSVTPRGPLPTLLFSHTQGRTTPGGTNSYTFINATKEFDKWRVFGNFNRIRNAPVIIPSDINTLLPNPPSISLSAGAMARISDSQTLQFSQSFGQGGSLSGDVDWFTSSFFSKRVSFGAGLGYVRSPSKFYINERFVAGVELPGRQMLQVSYASTPSGPQILLQLRGPLFTGRAGAIAATVSVEEMTAYGAFYGRVYQDVNLNGRFDAGVDRPQTGVKVQVDGSFYAVTDGNGEFRVNNVRVGEHQVYLDLLSVRADLTLLDSPQQTAMLNSGRDSIVDFRLVRTGRARGVVWMDTNGNGELDEGEQTLSDVRIVTASGRDTLTDSHGEFILGDLPPGNHIILVDEKTLPDNTKSAADSLQVLVVAGGETGDVKFPIVPKPVQIQVKRFPASG